MSYQELRALIFLKFERVPKIIFYLFNENIILNRKTKFFIKHCFLLLID